MKHTILLFATALLLGIQSNAQTGVAINTTSAVPDNSTMLDVSATDKGMLVPRMTEAQRIAIDSPAKGLLVYQNDKTEGFYYFDGTFWIPIIGGPETQSLVDVAAIGNSANTQLKYVTTATDAQDAATKAYVDALNLADVAATGNSVNTQLKNVTAPTDDQDAATKVYVDALLIRIEALKAQIYPSFLLNGFTDPRDNNHYNVVKIGNQIWMAENLKYLPSVVGPATGSDTEPYYYVCDYEGTDVAAAKATDNYQTYGVLYNWPAAMNGALSSNSIPSGVQGICPAGWHLPSHAECEALSDYVSSQPAYRCNGEPDFIGKALAAKTKWQEAPWSCAVGNNPATNNATGFTALPGGFRNTHGSFENLSLEGIWWPSSQSDASSAWCMFLYYAYWGLIDDSFYWKAHGFSVRCLWDD